MEDWKSSFLVTENTKVVNCSAFLIVPGRGCLFSLAQRAYPPLGEQVVPSMCQCWCWGGGEVVAGVPLHTSNATLSLSPRLFSKATQLISVNPLLTFHSSKDGLKILSLFNQNLWCRRGALQIMILNRLYSELVCFLTATVFRGRRDD